MSEVVTRVPISEMGLSNGNVGEIKDAYAREEYAALNGRIGALANLQTTDKSSIVAAVNEVAQNVSGVVSVDSSGKIPANLLPSYVDDVVSYASLSGFPAEGEDGKIYVAKDTDKGYRWNGAGYTELSTYDVATQSASGLMSAADKTKLDGIASGATANTGTITGITMNGASKGTSGVVDLGTVITAHQDISGKVSGPSSATNAHVAVFDGTTGKAIKDSGYTIAKSVPSDAKFTDTTYSAATTSASGLMSSTDKTKLNGIESGAQVNPGNATTSAAGLMSADDKAKLNGIASGATANVGTITGITMNGASKGTSGVVDLGTVITAHQDISGKVFGPSSSTDAHVAVFDGTTGKAIKDSGYTIAKSVPSDAKFTDTTYSAATTSAAGLMSAADKTKLNGIATGATANAGTITGIKMNGSSKGTSGVVDLGTVITSHQDISGKLNSSLKGAANGLAELDANGKVPSSQLPSFVDDVLEYDDSSSFPATGETGKIYVAADTNKTYRWSGTAYVEISASLALGETSSTAYRGDRGKTAYDHASAKGSAFESGLYKITTNAEGHVTAVTAVAKSDITALGIPGSDTTYSTVSKSAAGLCPTLPNENTTTKYLRQDGTWQTPPNDNTTYAFTNSAPTLSWGNTSTVGVVGGVALTVKMPGNPNTDTNTTYAFTNKAPTLAWNTTSTVGVAGGVAFTVKMPANPNTNTTYSFTNSAPTLSWGNTSTVGVAGGVAFTVKMPANPDTNTWRGIQNNLTSTSTTESLSAAQGKILNDKFSNYVYGNWSDVGTQVTNMAGQLNPPTGTNYIRVHIRCSNGSVAYCDFVKYG